MKYYYNKVTLEYCGTAEPVGDNFAYTEKKPQKYQSNESVLFKDGKWVVEKAQEEEIKLSEFDLQAERAKLMQEMQYQMLIGNQEEAKEIALRVKGINNKIADVKAKLNEA